MRIGILGSGVVGRTLGSGFVRAGHDVVLGSRTAGNEAATAWVVQAAAHGPGSAVTGTFADAARAAEVVVNATAGAHSLEARAAVHPGDLNGVVLLDVANPLDFSGGFPPALLRVVGDPPGSSSLAEAIQRTYPRARVVKAFNTVNAALMTEPAQVHGEHHLPVAGDDEGAKGVVRALAVDLGWRDEQLLDLGGLEAARGTEAYLLLWVRLMQATGTALTTIRVVRA
jgi:predicted dinucleotide-binding enzyme